ERVAEAAERDLTRYYHARWAKEHVGETFVGVVVGVTNFGVFVALANGVEGLMHVSHLEDDYYIYLEDSLMLMGKHTRKRYRMGDRVEVKIMAANPTQRQIDLVPASVEVTVPEAEEAPARTRRPKKLKDPSDGGIDAAFVTGRRSAPSAAAKAAQEASAGKGRRQRGKAKEVAATAAAEEEAAESRAEGRSAPGVAADGEAAPPVADEAPPGRRPAAAPAARRGAKKAAARP